MALDSDIHNADSHLHVTFYTHERAPHKGKPFVRIMVPGDKTNEIDQPVREDHKERFPRQWLHFQMQNSDGAPVIGTPLEVWSKDQPAEFTDYQMAELQVLKFQTVDQVATASDAQLQRVGMGGIALREKARAYLIGKNQSQSKTELDRARSEIDELKAQMAALMAAQSGDAPAKRGPGRPANVVKEA